MGQGGGDLSVHSRNLWIIAFVTRTVCASLGMHIALCVQYSLCLQNTDIRME